MWGQRVTLGWYQLDRAVRLIGQYYWTEPRVASRWYYQSQRAVGRVPWVGPAVLFGPTYLVGSGGWFRTYHLGRGVRTLQA